MRTPASWEGLSSDPLTSPALFLLSAEVPSAELDDKHLLWYLYSRLANKKVDVWDADTFSSDPLGGVIIPLAPLCAGDVASTPVDRWCDALMYMSWISCYPDSPAVTHLTTNQSPRTGGGASRSPFQPPTVAIKGTH